MWSGDITYEVGGKGFDPTVGKVLAPGGRTLSECSGVGVQSLGRLGIG